MQTKQTKVTVATPYQNSQSDKRTQVALMFDTIASRYDFLNHFLSAGIDRIWRKKAIRRLKGLPAARILDVATGTADLALESMVLKPAHITGIDIAPRMLAQGRAKIRKKGYGATIQLQEGDAEAISFPDASFDAVTCAFGVRNFAHLDKGLKEMCRVLRPGGKVVILEFAKPRIFPVKQLYTLYFHILLPLWGKLISRDPRAYSYLPESVQEFPDRSAFARHLKEAGFSHARWEMLGFGITGLYVAEKPRAVS